MFNATPLLLENIVYKMIRFELDKERVKRLSKFTTDKRRQV